MKTKVPWYKKGGLTTKKLHGSSHFSRIAKKRWRIKREKDKLLQSRKAKRS